MSQRRLPPSDDVDQLLLNARLRDELEPYIDESITRLDGQRVPTATENAYLASMLAWERAPVVPIAEWFHPPLGLPPLNSLSDDQVHAMLWDTIYRLFEKRIVLDFTEHLSDRELYRLIVRDILPSEEKKIEGAKTYLHWDCADVGGDPEIWLRHYANDEERAWWQEHTQVPLPPHEPPPYPRRMPRAPF